MKNVRNGTDGNSPEQRMRETGQKPVVARLSAVFLSETKPERQPGDSLSLSPVCKTGGEGIGKTIPRGRRLFFGKPMAGEGWSVVAENTGWLLQAGPVQADSPWRTLKLSSKIGRPYSANYWLAWNGCRLAENTEMWRLRDVGPETAEWVALTLEAFGV